MLDAKFHAPGPVSHTLSSVASVNEALASIPREICPEIGTSRLPLIEPSRYIWPMLTIHTGSGGMTPASGVTDVSLTGRPSAPSTSSASSDAAARKSAEATPPSARAAPELRSRIFATWPARIGDGRWRTLELRQSDLRYASGAMRAPACSPKSGRWSIQRELQMRPVANLCSL